MKLSQTAIKLILAVLAFATLISGVAILVYQNVNFVGGLLFGATFCIFKIIITERSIEHSVTIDAKSAESYIKAQYAIRYFLTGAFLISVALIDNINLYGAITGIILAQPAGYAVMFLESKVRISEK